jgi:hypothetical protein
MKPRTSTPIRGSAALCVHAGGIAAPGSFIRSLEVVGPGRQVALARRVAEGPRTVVGEALARRPGSTRGTRRRGCATASPTTTLSEEAR